MPDLWGDLWMDDDQMPACDPCLDGRHRECVEFMTTPPYGVHACGCENKACQ
jgi:hypothetical protein